MGQKITPLHRCGCGDVGIRRVLVFQGEDAGTGFKCEECLDKYFNTMDRVRPVFQALVAADINEQVANDTMAYLLFRMED